jgi:hypothetical protein
MKNWTLEGLRSEFNAIAKAFSAHYQKPAHVGLDLTERADDDSYFSIHISVGGNIVEMDSVESFSTLTAKVAKYKRLADSLADKDERERKQLASVFGISP